MLNMISVESMFFVKGLISWSVPKHVTETVTDKCAHVRRDLGCTVYESLYNTCEIHAKHFFLLCNMLLSLYIQIRPSMALHDIVRWNFFFSQVTKKRYWVMWIL